MKNATMCGGLALVAALAVAAPVQAQVSLVGEWSPRYHEDQPDRIPGPELGDYTGLPLTDGARLTADSWDASRLSLREHQCKVHIAPYILSRPDAVPRLRGQRSADAAARRHQELHQHLRAGAHDLDGRPAASAGVGAAHLDGVLDRQVGRRHPDRLHHPHQAGMDPPQRRAQQRPVHDHRALHPPRQHHDALRAVDRSGLSDRAVLPERRLRAERAHRRQLDVAVRIRRRDRRSAARATCRTSCQARARSRAISRIVRRAGRRGEGRRGDDVPGVRDEAADAAEAAKAGARTK